MTNQITIETLSPITHNQTPVITTELLAHLYGTERQRVTNNFNRNKERFIEGKHYFMVRGEDLENLKNSLRGFQNPIATNVRKLILWTERGAARHAKMLETDQAWEVFEKLEDCYFIQKKNSPDISCCAYDSRAVAYLKNGNVVSMYPMTDDQIVLTVDGLIQLMEKQGWMIFRKEELLTRLATAIGH